MRYFGTTIRGIRAPIIRSGDHLEDIVFDTVVKAVEGENIQINNKDVIAITEAVVARAQGNYATIEQIAAEVKAKFGSGTVGLVFPILSRNRFSMLLKAIALGVDKLIVQLSYPSDEVGNPLMSLAKMDDAGVDPYQDSFTESEFRKKFNDIKHPFTGVDYIEYYKQIANGNVEFILSNNPQEILKYTKKVLVADIHTRWRTKQTLQKHGVETVYGLDELLNQPVQGSGYNPAYGLLGSNLAGDNLVKLFPRESQKLVDALQARFKEKFHKQVEVMVYGDGAFKDPIGGIWELADPVISPAYTSGLIGTPNEIKLKYIADTKLKDLSGVALEEAMKKVITEKDDNLVNNILSQGTTPRRLTDLLGSLCDLTSGSGDKGTPIILIQGYFDNYSK